MTYERLRNVLRSDPAVEHGEGASPAEVAAAQERLGRLPADYCQFLLEFGWLAVRHYEVYGGGADVPPHLDVVAMGLEERADYDLASALVPVMNDGGGNLYCLDTAAVSRTDAVVLWDHESSVDIGPSIVADSFSEWLLDLLDAG